jgi:hypothetical protein
MACRFHLKEFEAIPRLEIDMTARRTLIATTSLAAGTIIAFFLASPTRAQVQIDASKITCDQFVHDKITNSRTLAAWLSGYYHGKRNDPIVDPEKFETNFNRLEKFCYDEKNFKLPVMRAIERAIENKK